MTDDLLTVAEYAEKARVSLPTVYRLVKSGRIPTLKIGSQIRIPASALEVKSA